MLRAVSHVPPQPIDYLFIDGGYLSRVLERFATDFYPTQRPMVDYKLLSENFTKVFYYNCPPPRHKDETDASFSTREAEYEALIRDISENPGWHVSHGVSRRHPKRGNVQKEVDVQIAVDLLTHSFKGNMHKAVLLAGDLDFRPVIEAVVKEGMYLTLWSDVRSTSGELRRSADARRTFDIWTYNGLLAPGIAKCKLPERHSVGPTFNAPLLEQAIFEDGTTYNLYAPGSGSYLLASQHRIDGASHIGYQVTPADFPDPLGSLKSFFETHHGKPKWITVPQARGS